MICSSWDLVEEESMAGVDFVEVLNDPAMAPKNMPMAQSPAIATSKVIPIFILIVYNKMLMKRILFLVLCVPVFGPQARGAAIEIYANGHKYDSLQTYLTSKEPVKAIVPSSAPVSLNSQQEDYIRKEAQQLGIKVDFSKVKTYQVNQKKIPDTVLHKLYVLSVENGVVNALQDFYEARGQSDFQISPEQLQGAIQQEVTMSKNPKLLISQPGKVRIMSLTAQGRED